MFDGKDDDVTSSPPRPGERQRLAYVDIPPWNAKNSKRKAQYIYMDLPPLPLNAQKSVRKAAIAARSLVDLARAKSVIAEEDVEEENAESEEEEGGEEVAELVIEGDKFLTRDDNDASIQSIRLPIVGGALTLYYSPGYYEKRLPSMWGIEQRSEDGLWQCRKCRNELRFEIL